MQAPEFLPTFVPSGDKSKWHHDRGEKSSPDFCYDCTGLLFRGVISFGVRKVYILRLSCHGLLSIVSQTHIPIDWEFGYKSVPIVSIIDIDCLLGSLIVWISAFDRL